MANLHIVRPSDSRFVHSVARSVASGNGQDLITPDGLRDILVVKRRGQTQILLMNAPLLRAVYVPYVDGQESQVVISFAIGTFFSSLLDNVGFYPLPMIGK